MASNNTRARKRARAESIPEESVDETQNLKQKLDIQRGKCNSLEVQQDILMNMLNIPSNERNFMSLRKELQNLLNGKERADSLICAMPMNDPENSFKCCFSYQKFHEKYCKFQKVLCPILNCEQLVIAHNLNDHFDQDHIHGILNFNDEWNFEFSEDNLRAIELPLFSTTLDNLNFYWNPSRIVCCLKSHHQEFFPQIYIKNDNLYFKVVMFGLQERVTDFKACFTFYQGTGKDYNVGVRASVYPMTENDNLKGFSIASLKKLTEYYDSESLEIKHQDNVRFSLEITDVRLEEMAKEKENSQKNPTDSILGRRVRLERTFEASGIPLICKVESDRIMFKICNLRQHHCDSDSESDSD